MVERKGVGYSIEAILSLLVIFIFVLGVDTPQPDKDWEGFQKEIAAKDIGQTLEKTGDLDTFVKRRETGSLQTAANTLSSGQLQLSGTIENVPLEKIDIGLGITPFKIENIPLQTTSTCSSTLNSNSPRLRTTNNNGPRLYLTDTDPKDGKNSKKSEYDTLHVVENTGCNIEEGPFYIDEFFYWPTTGNFYEFKYYSASSELQLHQANRVIRLKNTMKENVSGIDTKTEFSTFELSENTKEQLQNYDTIIFDEDYTLNQIASSNNRDKVDAYMKENPLILLADLNENDFQNYDFIQDSGLEWVDMGYNQSPGNGINFTDSEVSQQVRTYFQGMNGSRADVSIGTGGRVSSSNSDTVMDRNKFVVGWKGSYDTDDWNATHYSMSQVDPSNVDGDPDSACTTNGNTDKSLTAGWFSFPEYPGHSGGNMDYRVINTELGKDSTYCSNNEDRALNINLTDDTDFSDPGEGPHINQTTLTVENKSYMVYFPDNAAMKDGEVAEFVYDGNPSVEKVNIRESFRDSDIEKFVRFPYNNTYNTDDRKLLASIIYHSAADKKTIKSDQEGSISTNVIGSLEENTYLPYKANLRWK